MISLKKFLSVSFHNSWRLHRTIDSIKSTTKAVYTAKQSTSIIH